MRFGYDADGLLTTAGALSLTRRSDNGLLQSDTLGVSGGSWSFDSRGALSSHTARASGSALYSGHYVRDSLGRVTVATDTIQGAVLSRAFTYDSAGRVSSATENGTLVRTYGYDANGNRTSLTGPGLSLSGGYDAQDRLLTYGTATYTYDRDGSLTLKVVGLDTTRYVYDALGNLLNVTLPDATVIEYLVDAQNRRIGRKVNGALQQAWLWQSQLAPTAELDGSGAVVSRFVYATRPNVPDYLVKGGVTYRLVLDQLGSVRLVVNTADGTVAQRLDYDEFGRVTQNTNPGFQPFGYAGGMYEEQTGLVRFGLRDYDPVSGRWSSKEPLGFAGGFANLYTYAGNDPLSYVDPTGEVVVLAPLLWWVARGAVAGCVGGALESILLQRLLQGCVDRGQVIKDCLIGAIGGAFGGALKGLQGLRALGRSRTFFRGVGLDELADIRATNALRLKPGGAEGKYFTNTIEAAAKWGARNPEGFGVIEARFPSSVAGQFESLGRIDAIGEAWVARADALVHATVRIVR